MKEMKTLIRKYLPSSTDDDADSMVSTSTRGGKGLSQQDKSSILARNLRALDHEDAEKMLVDIYTSVGEALRRLSTQTKVLLDVTSQMQSPPDSRTSLEGTRSPPRSPNIASMSEKLANELLDAYNGTGATIKRREDTHRMAEANRAFSHFRV